MESTKKTKAIVLRREPFNENDSRVFVYTQYFGKLSLIARGTQKLSSKLVAHIEPLNLCEVMIIKGRQYDYLGSCISEDVFSGIKNDYNKSKVAGESARIIDGIVKGEEKDEQIFLMLNKFLEILNNNEMNNSQLILLKNVFVLKLVSLLGYQPNLNDLQIGKDKISLKLANFIQMVLVIKFEEILDMILEENLILEFEKIITQYILYIFD